jgi:hypothetical protein
MTTSVAASGGTSKSFPAYRHIQEPPLAFHPDRTDDQHIHPLKGLLKFGPYSRSILYQVFDPIRVATIYPHKMSGRLDNLFREFEMRHIPHERKQYLPEFIGFSRIFGLRIVRASGSTGNIELAQDTDAALSASDKPHALLAERIHRALSLLDAHRSEFDVVMILLPESWQSGFDGSASGEDFDLHDYIKAVSATRGVPTQIVRERSALEYRCRASVMWRLSIALYCKAGGVPWKLANADPDMAYVGLSYALRQPQAGQPQFVTCCSQVFDADGTGLEFLAYDTADARVEQENPFLDRNEMRRVMARSLALYQKRHDGRPPKRVAVHKTTRFTADEIEGCFDAWGGAEEIELVQVQDDSPWRGILMEPKPRANNRFYANNYPIHRGTYIHLAGNEVLLWTQGNAPAVAGGSDYYKEGKGIPSPLLLRRFAGHGDWDEACRWIVGLTKMDWNNDALYDRLPVTLNYASTLARTLKRLPYLGSKHFQFRFFM